MSTKKKKKASNRRQPSRRAASGSGAASAADEVPWRNILIGFQGDRDLDRPARLRQVKSARQAIEDTFKRASLRRWTNVAWKRTRVPGGGERLAGLARLVTDELNRGLKPAAGKTFRVVPEQPVVGVEMRIADSVSYNPPDIKPDGTLCWWKTDTTWVDDVTFRILLDEGAGASARARSSGGGDRPWRPDGRHEMLVRLVFDCPYEPARRFRG